MLTLEIELASGTTKVWRLLPGESVRVGCDDGADLGFQSDTPSGLELRHEREALFLSRTGPPAMLFLNGRPCSETPVRLAAETVVEFVGERWVLRWHRSKDDAIKTILDVGPMGDRSGLAATGDAAMTPKADAPDQTLHDFSPRDLGAAGDGGHPPTLIEVPLGPSTPWGDTHPDAVTELPGPAPHRTRVSDNPTFPWEAERSGAHVVIERPDTSAEPVHIPKALRRRPRLMFLEGPHADRQVFVGTDVLRIGRGENNDVVLDDPLIAPEHCSLDGLRLCPKRGTAPVAVNGRLVTGETQLAPGDVLSLGSSLIELFVPADIEEVGGDAGWKPSTTVSVQLPRYSANGRVMMKLEVTIGRDPNAEVFIDDDEVGRHHAKVTAEGGNKFRIREVDGNAIYKDGRRLVEHALADGDVLFVGGHRLYFHLDHLLCRMEITAPDRSELLPASRAEPRPLYRLSASVTPESAEAKKAPARWRPPMDVARTHRGPVVAATAAVFALSLAGYFAAEDGADLLRRPVSMAHSSSRFQEQGMAHFGADGACGTCHQASLSLAESCGGCHESHAPRGRHLAQAAEDDRPRPSACTDCHAEHRGVAAGSPALVDGEACAGCHASRHQDLLAATVGTVSAKPPKLPGTHLDLRADLGMSRAESVAKIHEVHGDVAHRCVACHHSADAPEAKTNAWGACLRCHDALAALNSNDCGGCHREHGDDWSLPPEMASASSTSLRRAGGAMLAVVCAFLLAGIIYQLWRDRRLRIRAELEAKAMAEQQAQAADVRLVHNINLEKCVGCASCVNACPHDVLELEPVRHKSTVVRQDDCNQCRACEQICPSGALTMAPAGAPPRMIELPDLDANYMTNLPGVYLIGEAAGRSLVKNANNLGYRVILHALQDGLRPGDAKRLGFDREVLVVGSGPGGLSAGITACQNGLTHAVFEKDRLVASTIQTYPKGKELLEEPPGIENVGPLPVWDSYREEIIERWTAEIAKYPLDIRCGEEVQNVEAIEHGFRVTTSAGVYTACRIVLATGTRGNPRKLGVEGEALEKVRYRLVDPAEHKGDRIVVVGGGDSAVEAAMAMADAHGGGQNRVAIAYRGKAFSRVKERNLAALDGYVTSGQVEVLFETRVVEIASDRLCLVHGDGSESTMENDFVYCMLGADPPTAWLRKIGVQYVKKPENWSAGPTDDLSFLNLVRLAS